MELGTKTSHSNRVYSKTECIQIILERECISNTLPKQYFYETCIVEVNLYVTCRRRSPAAVRKEGNK